MYYLLETLLRRNSIRLDWKELKFQLLSHPSYPSLHAVSGVLDHFHIHNMGVRVPVKKEILTELPASFLAQVHSKHGDQFVIVNQQETHYQIIDENRGKARLSLDQFLQKFTGVLIAVEKNEQAPSAKYLRRSSLPGVALLLASAVLIGLFLSLNLPDALSGIHVLLSAFGLFIARAIISQEQGVSTALGEAFCAGVSEKKDCNAVLSSKGSQLFGRYKLSDLAIVFFSGLLLSTVFMTFQGMGFKYLFIISLAAIPVIVFSVYYQYAIVQKWCALCLGLAGILGVQAALAFFALGDFSGLVFMQEPLFTLGAGFLLALTVWYFAGPALRTMYELKEEIIEHVRFRKSYELFSFLLSKSAPLDTEIPGAAEIVLGAKEEANLNIVIVTNPFCSHCKAVHTLMEDILNSKPKATSITVRFNVNTTNGSEDLTKITTRLLEIYHTQGEKDCLKSLHGIYLDHTPEQWFAEWGTCDEPDKYLNTLEKESEWCISNNLNFTPSILVNGRSFPNEYNRGDLKFFIEELEESGTKTSDLKAAEPEPTKEVIDKR